MITPLRRRTLTGDLYRRDERIEAILTELELLSRDDLLARCEIKDRADQRHVPSECLLYFVRASRTDNSDAFFERLYKVLNERVLRALPKAESADGKTLSVTKAKIREKVFDRFVTFLASDRQTYVDKLDYFELRFDGAVANLRRDAQDQGWREENRSTTLDYDAETGELSSEVERAAGNYNPFDTKDSEADGYRSGLQGAIDALPPEQSRIIEMIRKGFPIDSKDPDVMTIAKAMGKSEKTIRTHRDKAYAALRNALTSGDEK